MGMGGAVRAQDLARLGAGCAAVVICRSSPSQKAGVVRMMAEHEMRSAEGGSRGLLRWYRRQMKKQAGRMLAVGDGANDVAMIQVQLPFWLGVLSLCFRLPMLYRSFCSFSLNHLRHY